MKQTKYKRHSPLAKASALETVRNYLRAGSTITIAIFNAARDCHMPPNTLSHLWYKAEREGNGRESGG